MNKPVPNKTDSLRQIKTILWENWDPIGINNFGNENKDEYDQYANQLLQLRYENKNISEISEALNRIVTDMIGLFPDREKSKAVAKLIFQSKQVP